MFKRRDKVEKRFRNFKSNLNADVCYLRDDLSVAGHVFVSFLSLYMLAQLEDRIRRADLLSKYSVYDVLHPKPMQSGRMKALWTTMFRRSFRTSMQS